MFTSLAARAEQSNNPLGSVFTGENARTRGPVSLSAGKTTGAIRILFHPAESRSQIEFDIPKMAANWSACVCLCFPFRTSHPARWFFDIVNDRNQHFEFRIQPLQGVQVFASIPGRYLFEDYANNRRFKAYTLVNWNQHIDLTCVKSVIVGMRPHRDVELELGPLAQLDRPVPDGFHVDGPVVNRFGAWIDPRYSNADVLRAAREAWKREDSLLRQEPIVHTSGPPVVEASGYFRTTFINERWWLVDPDGKLFFSAGLNCVRLGGDETQTAGRRELFEHPRSDFYKHNAIIRYGRKNLEQRWAIHTVRRLAYWGFNTVGAWSNLNPKRYVIPFVVDLNIQTRVKNWHGFPDVFDPQHRVRVAECVRDRVISLRHNRSLIGYFLQNEPHWRQRDFIEAILHDPDRSATQDFARAFLGDLGPKSPLRQRLVELLTRRHFQIMCDAVRAFDPNHLILGVRYVAQPIGFPPEPIVRASDTFDVFTANIYKVSPSREYLAWIDGLAGKPILIGEFHFGAAGRGLGGSLVEVADQEQRAAAYEHYIEQAAAHPSVIGAHYFQFKDQPVTGRFDGENFNIGFVDVLDCPYEPLVNAARRAHGRLFEIHSGRVAPAPA